MNKKSKYSFCFGYLLIIMPSFWQLQWFLSYNSHIQKKDRYIWIKVSQSVKVGPFGLSFKCTPVSSCEVIQWKFTKLPKLMYHPITSHQISTGWASLKILVSCIHMVPFTTHFECLKTNFMCVCVCNFCSQNQLYHACTRSCRAHMRWLLVPHVW